MVRVSADQAECRWFDSNRNHKISQLFQNFSYYFLKYTDSSDNKVTSFYKGSNPLLTVMVDWWNG